MTDFVQPCATLCNLFEDRLHTTSSYSDKAKDSFVQPVQPIPLHTHAHTHVRMCVSTYQVAQVDQVAQSSSTNGDRVINLFEVVTQVAQTLESWRLSCGMEPEHLARELGFDTSDVLRLENGTKGLVGRSWVAEQLLALGCPSHVVKRLQSTPDCKHTTTHQHINSVEHIDGTWHSHTSIFCSRCGWHFGEVAP